MAKPRRFEPLEPLNTVRDHAFSAGLEPIPDDILT
jgi:hypothetical protein